MLRLIVTWRIMFSCQHEFSSTQPHPHTLILKKSLLCLNCSIWIKYLLNIKKSFLQLYYYHSCTWVQWYIFSWHVPCIHYIALNAKIPNIHLQKFPSLSNRYSISVNGYQQNFPMFLGFIAWFFMNDVFGIFMYTLLSGEVKFCMHFQICFTQT